MITVDVMHIKSADASEFDRFSIARIRFQDSNLVAIFLPAGKAQAVADAINAALLPDIIAVQPDMAVIDEVGL